MNTRPEMLHPPVDVGRDHVLGLADGELTLVEYSSYACRDCHAVHEDIEGLRSRFGERMRHVFRYLPVAGSEDAVRAAELAEAAAKIAVFIASLIAPILGMIILYPRRDEETVRAHSEDRRPQRSKPKPHAVSR